MCPARNRRNALDAASPRPSLSGPLVLAGRRLLALAGLLLLAACAAEPLLPPALEDGPLASFEPAGAAPQVTTEEPVELAGVTPEAPAPALDPVALAHECRLSAAEHETAARTAGAAAASLREHRLALAHEPSSLPLLRAVAAGAARTHDLPLARSAFRLWMAEDPRDATPAVTLARLELEEGDERAAASLADAALVRDLENAEAFHLKGRLLLRAEELPAAIAAFESAIELDPGHAFAFNNLGLCFLRTGEWGRAVEALSAATLLRPDVAYMHNNLGLAYEKLGHGSEALAEYRTAVVLDPRYVKAAVNLRRVSRVAAVGPSAHAPVGE